MSNLTPVFTRYYFQDCTQSARTRVPQKERGKKKAKEGEERKKLKGIKTHTALAHCNPHCVSNKTGETAFVFITVSRPARNAFENVPALSYAPMTCHRSNMIWNTTSSFGATQILNSKH